VRGHRPGNERPSFSLITRANVRAIAGVIIAVLAFSAIVCGLSKPASADPQNYCAAFAEAAANGKTGVSADALRDEKWRSAYDKAFAVCMSDYGPQQTATSSITAQSKPEKAKTRAERKSVKTKVSLSARKSSTRKRAARPRRGKALAKATTASPQRIKSGAKAPAVRSAALCRRLQVDKGGNYRIANCRPPPTKIIQPPRTAGTSQLRP
jgi:hypothetical protein